MSATYERRTLSVILKERCRRNCPEFLRKSTNASARREEKLTLIGSNYQDETSERNTQVSMTLFFFEDQNEVCTAIFEI